MCGEVSCDSKPWDSLWSELGIGSGKSDLQKERYSYSLKALEFYTLYVCACVHECGWILERMCFTHPLSQVIQQDCRELPNTKTYIGIITLKSFSFGAHVRIPSHVCLEWDSWVTGSAQVALENDSMTDSTLSPAEWENSHPHTPANICHFPVFLFCQST